MKVIKLNRKHTVNSDNIEKLVIKKCKSCGGGTDRVWVYRKQGYPKVYKTDYNFYMFRLQLTNLGLKLSDFIVEDKRQPMKVVHCKKEPFDVYIGRPQKWGNSTIG